LHKAFLALSRREQLADAAGRAEAHGREDLIGSGKQQLVPRWQPKGTGGEPEGAAERRAAGREPRPAPFRTQHVRYRTSDKT